MADLTFEITDVPPDVTPEPEELSPTGTVTQPQGEWCDKCNATHSCGTCGKALTYGGRGKHPTQCDEHKRTAAKSTSPRVSGRGQWQQPLCDALVQQFAMVGVGVYAVNAYDGQAILNGSPALAQSLVSVAETNPRVREALQKLVTAGAWAGVAAAVAGIAIPILQNHNLIPALPFPMPKVA